MEMSQADITRIVEAFEASDWQHLRVALGDTLLELSKSGSLGPAGAPAATHSPVASEPVADLPVREAVAAAPPRAAQPLPEGLQHVLAPSVGVFWRAPSPTSPPFVSEGDTVAKSDTVCIVEVMKLMNHVAAGVSGTVDSILVENGQMVERGQALFLVKSAP